MAIYLVQHGLSLPEDVDPQQGLTQEGRADVERIAHVAQSYKVNVDLILHSGKTRARQSAEIMGAYLHPDKGIHVGAGLDSKDNVKVWAHKLDAEENCMLVGHLPFLEKLASFLVTGKSQPRIFKLQNGGILCLDKREGDWVITWAIMPKIV